MSMGLAVCETGCERSGAEGVFAELEGAVAS